MILGIDYGSKMAGTTAIALMKKYNEVELFQSKKNQDADQMIIDFVLKHKDIWLVFLDAPMSLPSVYNDGKSEDYFYRAADKALSAMSPMFLGGLTARAMKLKRKLNNLGLKVVETYPKALSEEILLDQKRYKKDPSYIHECALAIRQIGNWQTQSAPTSWHQIDAMLCLLSAKRNEQGKSKSYGNEEEGLIII